MKKKTQIFSSIILNLNMPKKMQNKNSFLGWALQSLKKSFVGLLSYQQSKCIIIYTQFSQITSDNLAMNIFHYSK